MFVLVLTNRVGVNEYNDEGKCLRVISIKVKWPVENDYYARERNS